MTEAGIHLGVSTEKDLKRIEQNGEIIHDRSLSKCSKRARRSRKIIIIIIYYSLPIQISQCK